MAAETQDEAEARAWLAPLQHKIDMAIAGRRPMVHVHTNDLARLVEIASGASGVRWTPRAPSTGTRTL